MKNLFRAGLMIFSIISTYIAKAQVPVMSSYPSASATIFLDFDGQTVSGTSWNYNGPIYCAASGLDSSQITQVFNRAAEDYRPFNVNVTTDSTKYWAAPATRRIRVILTTSWQWYGSAGGVSFVGSFTWGDNTPCFVFTSLLNYNTKNIGEAAAHEAGHTLGLYHQALYDASCNLVSQYNPGQGSGEIGWAPIMGVGYYQNMTLWNNGPNPYGCANAQNDLTVITTNNGFTYRTDDYGNTFATASTQNFTSQQFTASGVIEQSTDVDMFKFTLPIVCHFTLNAIPYNVGTNNTGSDLDIELTLYDNSQTVMNTYNPSSLLSATIDTTLAPGTYYVKVRGTGNTYAPNYASLGSYTLNGAYSTYGILPLHRLELHGASNGDTRQFSWIIEADEQVVKQILEVSTDGTNFTALTQPLNADRSYSYKTNLNGAAFYRLNVTFDNGNQYYSNTVTLKDNDMIARPKLLGNPVSSNTVMVSSPGNYNYVIYDLNGKMINKGRLTNGINTIQTPEISSGVYVIHFMNEQQNFTDKFIRQ